MAKIVISNNNNNKLIDYCHQFLTARNDIEKYFFKYFSNDRIENK